MSATNRGAKRATNDFYATPSWCVHRLLDELPLCGHGVHWLEPCAGDGAIINAVASWHYARDMNSPAWRSIDIEPRAHVIDHVDYLSGAERGERYSVCCTNPPYSLAMDFIVEAALHCDVVCMLLRLNFLASDKRAAFLRRNPPDVYVLPNRPDFTGDGGDATEYAWFVWYPGTSLGTKGMVKVLGTTPWEVRRNVRR